MYAYTRNNPLRYTDPDGLSYLQTRGIFLNATVGNNNDSTRKENNLDHRNRYSRAGSPTKAQLLVGECSAKTSKQRNSGCRIHTVFAYAIPSLKDGKLGELLV
jgi:hypothetical protein